MSNVKKGELATICSSYLVKELHGAYVTIERQMVGLENVYSRGGLRSYRAKDGGFGWVCEGRGDDFPRAIADRHLRPIRDQPGNEQFVVEARKSLPRPATAKGDTIDARGEVHS